MYLKTTDLTRLYTFEVYDKENGNLIEKVELKKVSRFLIKHHLSQLKKKYTIKQFSHYEEGFNLKDILENKKSNSAMYQG